jgi:aryl-alcohol dehydrogenase (NADP+)
MTAAGAKDLSGGTKRRLGRTDLLVSPLCIGSMTFGLQCDEAQSRAILDAAVAGGINLVDTADVYPLGGDYGHVGVTEAIVGRWLKDRPRGDIVLISKCGKQSSPDPADEGMSRRHILASVDRSLRRLGVDYIDLYKIHRDYPATPLDEMLEAFDSLVKAGKIRHFGLSNFLAYRVARALGRSEALGLARPQAVQNRYSLLFRQFERDLFPLCQEDRIGLMTYNPLAGGLLTGKHDRNAPPDPGTRFTLGTAAEDYQQRYWKEREFDTVDALRAVAAEAGRSMAETAIAWVLANPAVTSVMLGASRPGQLDDAFAAAAAPLDPALKLRLDELTKGWRLGDAVR